MHERKKDTFWVLTSYYYYTGDNCVVISRIEGSDQFSLQPTPVVTWIITY